MSKPITARVKMVGISKGSVRLHKLKFSLLDGLIKEGKQIVGEYFINYSKSFLKYCEFRLFNVWCNENSKTSCINFI